MERLTNAFSDIRLIANEEPRNRAEELIPAIGQLSTSKVPQKESEIAAAVQEMQVGVRAVGSGLAEFNEAAREDLGHDKKDHWWKRRATRR